MDLPDRVTKILTLRAAIAEHARGRKSFKGSLECTNCGGKAHYIVAYNNHIQASCEGCDLAFRE